MYVYYIARGKIILQLIIYVKQCKNLVHFAILLWIRFVGLAGIYYVLCGMN